jgi:hypothetical protein
MNGNYWELVIRNGFFNKFLNIEILNFDVKTK